MAPATTPTPNPLGSVNGPESGGQERWAQGAGGDLEEQFDDEGVWYERPSSIESDLSDLADMAKVADMLMEAFRGEIVSRRGQLGLCSPLYGRAIVSRPG